MGFLSVCTALYDYQPQSAGELELTEGDILYIVEKSAEDDWWKAKKRATAEDEDEPEGLIPNNYVEDAQPIHAAKALYDYTRQTEEEVSFSEDATIHVYDTSDPDWTLVAVDGDYGFAPANYIEITGDGYAAPSAYAPDQHSSPPVSPARDPAGTQARLANIMGVAPASPPATRQVMSPPLPPRQYTPEPSDEEQPPPKPARPISQSTPSVPSISYQRDDSPAASPGIQPSPAFRGASSSDDALRSPGGYHLYNISEMVSALGRRKKMPITLGLNIATGTIMLSPEKSRDGPTQEWSADRLDHYSIEGKHVFLELNRPSKSLDLHAGAKDTAQEIVAGLGEIAGAARGAGLREIIDVSKGGHQKKGVVSYDFMAQGEDEVTVAEGDEVLILDDTKSEEWWNVRRLKSGKEGVVPSSYIEITGSVAVEPPSRSGLNAGLSPVEQNRREEERLAKEAARADRARRADEEARRDASLPERASSLGDDDRRSSKKDKRPSKSDGKPRSKPDQSKVRTWTDHSGSFRVDAQFLGVADGKIHLHKANGVKIAVPIAKMSQTDLDYVEKVTNEPIEDNIPVADLIKMKRRNQESSRPGASIERSSSPAQQNKPPDYDWFDFFLTAGVGPHQCERYAQAMVRDSMDETVLPDINMETLRTIGLKEGDAIKVMRHLDQRFGRNRANGEAGGLFTNADGTLKKNTGRERPDANRAGTDTVDPGAFQSGASRAPADAQPTPTGFDDDAWTPKPTSRSVTPSAPLPPQATAAKPPSDDLQALASLMSLEPTPAPQRPASQPQAPRMTQSPPPAPQQQQQQTGATPQLFQQVAHQITNPRQRPQAPQQNFNGLLSPPPRPTSAPQHAQQNQFGQQPLQPQLTGVSGNTHVAPAGQSLDELTAQRMQQYLRPQQTGFMQPGMQMQNGFQPQPTGFQQPQYGQMQQSIFTGNAAGSPFADPRSGMQPQPTGFNTFQQQPQQTGVNSMLPPALTPQRTGFPNAQPQMQQNGTSPFQPQQTGFQPQGLQSQPTGFQSPFQAQQTGYQLPLQAQPTGFNHTNGFGNSNLPPVPPMPQSNTPAPLMPQKTGPAPEIRFGVNPAAKRLVSQPTGRADLSKASEYLCPMFDRLMLIFDQHLRTHLASKSTLSSIDCGHHHHQDYAGFVRCAP